MKVKELIKKLYSAILNKQEDLQEKIYRKITKKSLKGKNTQAVR
jgi:transcription termination factor NusB